MYTRDFRECEVEMNIPPAYSGNAFSDGDTLHKEDTEECISKKDGGIMSALSRLVPGGKFDFGNLPFLKKGFGTEEILILALAAFLLFSKDGDKECAVILLLVLFLN